MKLWVAAVVAGLLTAGCSGNAHKSADPLVQGNFDDLGLQATSTTGVIRGLVVDDAIHPVANATVTIAGTQTKTTSDANGLFGFDSLEARTYFLQIAKRGYKSAQQSADVAAGVAQPPVVKVLLTADKGTLPYYEQTTHHGFIQCGFLLANFVFDASSCDPKGLTGLSANDDSAPWFAVSGKPTYYQSEMTWEPVQEFSKSLVTIQYACNEGDCGETDTNRLCNVRGPAPLICKVSLNESSDGGSSGGGGHGIDESGLGADLMGYSTEMFAGCYQQCVIGAVGAGVSLQQPYDVYNTVFFGYEPPADWTFLSGTPVPNPPS
jgi:hypothetical protein